MAERETTRRFKTVEFPIPVGCRIPEIVIYDEENFKGNSYRTYFNLSYVGEEMNDKIRSIVVISGTWQLYKDAGFRVKLGEPLFPGYYPNLKSYDVDNKGISSIKCINP